MTFKRPFWWSPSIQLRIDTCVNCGESIYLAKDYRWYHTWVPMMYCPNQPIKEFIEVAEPYNW